MSDFIEENERVEMINLEALPDSLIFKIPENEFTYSCEKFGVNQHLNIEFWEKRFERAFPGLLVQFPCLYYMVEDMMKEGTKRTPLEEIEFRKKNE
jgi:hypothetical protein